MAVIRELRRRARQIAPQVLLACTLGYFAYHMVQGDRGIPAWLRVEQELVDVRQLRAELAAERARLEWKVGLMRPDHLDRDMLDERARLLLNLGRPDELVILLPSGEALDSAN